MKLTKLMYKINQMKEDREQARIEKNYLNFMKLTKAI